MSALAKSQKKKAVDFCSQAEALLSKKSWFSSKERNQEDAAELLQQAANAYKVGGLSQEAGDVYVRAGELYRDSLNNMSEASKSYSQAGACYKRVNPVEAVSAYQSAVSLLTDAGRLTAAAKLCKECAELFEQDEVEGGVASAIENYEQAAELFALEESKSQASACRAKVAELCSAALDPPDLIRAAGIYEELGRNCLESNLLKFNAKGYFLQSVFCHLANSDSVAAEQSMAKFEALDYTFTESREGKFAGQLVETVMAMDSEGFSTACFEYDRISKLDPWKTSMLVKVKRSIESGEDEEEDDVDLT